MLLGIVDSQLLLLITVQYQIWHAKYFGMPKEWPSHKSDAVVNQHPDILTLYTALVIFHEYTFLDMDDLIDKLGSLGVSPQKVLSHAAAEINEERVR